MNFELFEPDRHEIVCDHPWNEDVVRRAIRTIVDCTRAAFTEAKLWPVHPNDEPNFATPLYELYHGAAGVIWAMDYLARAGACDSDWRINVSPEEFVAPNRAIEKGNDATQSLLTGDTGILLSAWGRSPSPGVASTLADVIASNAKNPALELMWGAPGTMLAALAMFDATGEERWLKLYRTSASEVIDAFVQHDDIKCRMWTQDLYGKRSRMLGAVHGFAGNAIALIRGQRLLDEHQWKRLSLAIAESLAKTAMRGERGVNWPPTLEASHASKPSKLLLQHCHGAPGIVTCLAELGEPIDDLLIGGGELTWNAGPLGKGAFLCHGTSGNGYAFLKLFRRTGDEMWLVRARSFAMHAIAQSEEEFREFGTRRYSLWTGDLGLAVYLWDCVRGQARFPTMDIF